MLANFTKLQPACYAGIKGTGYYVPERIVSNKELEKYVDTTDEWIQKKTGIKERRIAAENEATSDLALKAAQMAIEDAQIDVLDIDLIILNCICPDHRDPATACFIQAKLGAYNAAAFDVNSGSCPGTVYALNTGCNFIVSGICKNVLVIGADVFTSIVDWRDRSTCCFFGDGAGAVVLGRTSKPGIVGYSMYADGKGYKSLIIPQGGSRARVDNVSVNTGLKDNSACLFMDGKAIWKFATNAFPDSVKELADEIGVKLSEIDVVIPHQANINIIKEGMCKLGIPFEKAVINLDRYGNTASASVFIALAEAVRDGRISAGHRIVMSAFGGGLAWATVMLEWIGR